MAIRRAGQLRHRITVQTLVETLDSLGKPIYEWQTTGRRFAKVQDLSGREFERARQQVTEASVSVTLRTLAGLSESDRFIFRGRILNIGAILDPDNNARESICLCSEEKPK